MNTAKARMTVSAIAVTDLNFWFFMVFLLFLFLFFGLILSRFFPDNDLSM